MAKNNLHAGAPTFIEDGAHRRYETIDNASAIVRQCILENIHPDRILALCAIQVADVIVQRRGNVAQNGFREIAVWIDEQDSITACNILRRDVAEKGGLSRSGRSDHRGVTEAILQRKREDFAAAGRSNGRVV